MRSLSGLLVVAAAIGGLLWAFPETLERESARMSLLYYAVWAFVAVGAIGLAFRGRRREVWRNLLVWLVLGAGLVGLYSYRDEARGIAYRVAGELVPGFTYESGKGEVTLRKAADGHFYVQAQINGQRTRLMVDTGASNVVLSADAAGRAGIPVDRLSFNVPVSTANGRTMAARTLLDHLQVGDVRVSRVAALVARPGDLDLSLLGMSFLGRVQGFEVAGGRMIIRQ